MTRRAQRITAGVGAALLAAGIGLGGTATATADPISDAGNAAYQALFNAGVPVYEVIAVDEFPTNGRAPAGSTGPDNGRYLHMIRIPDIASGQPWTVKYAIAGAPLPNDFWLPTDISGGRAPYPKVNPRPHPAGYGTIFDTIDHLVLQVGPVNVPGIGPIAGAVAL